MEKTQINEADKAREEQAKANDGKPSVEATKPAENVKVVAPAGTVPSSMQAGGPTPPHPSSDLPDKSADTPEVSEARARAEGADSDEGTKALNVGDPVGQPIQCIVKRRFFDERQALIREGSTYYYQRRKGTPFPYDNIEPVSKATAAAMRKEAQEAKAEKAESLRLRSDRREALRRLVSDVE